MKSNQYIAKFISIIDTMDKQSMLDGSDRIPGLIMSHPGFGKTSSVRKWCKMMDYNLFTIIPSQHSSDDILGINCMKDGNMVRLTPSWYNKMMDMMSNNKRTVLLIDEISTCDSYIQGPLLDLIFSRSLGEQRLPDDVFIIAAGNYASDLYHAFRMSAPIVNRFMILNLWNKDYGVADFLEDNFNDIQTKEEIKEYFGMNDNKKVYDFKKFKEWLKTSREVTMGKSTCNEDEDYGLLGFTSPRSLSFSLKFAQEYMATYSDGLWMRIVGDTLGTSERREGKSYRTILEANKDIFRRTGVKANGKETIHSVCNDIKAMGLTDALLDRLEEIVDSTPASGISGVELKVFSEVVAVHYRNKRVLAISNRLTEKMESL